MRFVTILCVLVCVSLLISCTPTKMVRGNYVDDSDLQTLGATGEKRGLTISDVASVLGSPTTVSAFNNNIWYYIGQHTEQTGVFDQEVIDEKIIIVEFEENGDVKRIVKSQGERIDIPYSRDETPTYGNEVTVLQNLLGNIGRFNPPQN